MKILRGTILLGSLLLVSCAAAPTSHDDFGPPQTNSDLAQAQRYAVATFLTGGADDDYSAAWVSALKLLALDAHPRAYKLLVDLTNSDRFEGLSPARRHVGLLLTGLVGLEQRDDSFAHRTLMRASEMPQAGVADWEGRYATAFDLQDHLDALNDLTTLVSRWPGILRDLSADAIRQLLDRDPDGDAEREARLKALNGLFDAAWTPYEGMEPEGQWRMLVEESVERGDLPRAAKVVRRISSPQILLALRVDRRYDPLVRLAPDRFDLTSAMAEKVSNYERSVREFPRSLDAVVQLTYAYMDVGRYSDVLTMTDQVIERVTIRGGVKSLYDDGSDGLHWLYENRARAQAALGDDADAELEMRSSAERLEKGQANVSNVIDLGYFLVDRGRPEEARAVIATLPNDLGNLSPYGMMQRELVLLHAAVELKDATVVEETLAYLRKHLEDDPGAAQFGVFLAGNKDEAAQILIRRLQDPKMRRDALIGVQQYAQPARPAIVKRTDEELKEWRKRADIQAQITKVGRIEKVPFPES